MIKSMIHNKATLKVDGLFKQFGSYTAVNRISFAVHKGEILGLLGPNGAGKSTTIQMLLGLTTPNGGAISYFDTPFEGKNRLPILSRINFASSYNNLNGRLSVWENLIAFAYLYRVKNPANKLNELLKYFDMMDTKKQEFWNLSAGQRTRINLVKALMNDPEVLLLDEPTASLDPDIADKLLTLIEQLQQDRGISIVYTSHNMDEVVRICDRVVFMDRGTIIAQDTPKGLSQRIKHSRLHLTFAKKIDDALMGMCLAFDPETTRLSKSIIELKVPEAEIVTILSDFAHSPHKIIDIEMFKPSLQDFFLHIARAPEEPS